MNYTAALGLSSAAGPNGDTLGIAYDEQPPPHHHRAHRRHYHVHLQRRRVAAH